MYNWIFIDTRVSQKFCNILVHAIITFEVCESLKKQFLLAIKYISWPAIVKGNPRAPFLIAKKDLRFV